jgi:hypothetical protein
MRTVSEAPASKGDVTGITSIPKQSFGEKCVPKLELGNEGVGTRVGGLGASLMMR